MGTNELRKWLIEHEPTELREATCRMLRGEGIIPAENRFVDSPPEDPLIEWLNDSSLQPEYRDPILRGCKDVLAQCHVGMITEDNHFDSATLIRVCRVVDVAAPDELYGSVTALLTLALRTPSVPANAVTAAVRAGMAYRVTKDDIPLWEEVARRPETAAYGFNALLQIAPQSENIPELLVELWIHQLVDGWNVDMPSLVRRAMRETDKERLPYLIVETVYDRVASYSRCDDLRDRLLQDVTERRWSVQWASAIENDSETESISRLEGDWIPKDPEQNAPRRPKASSMTSSGPSSELVPEASTVLSSDMPTQRKKINQVRSMMAELLSGVLQRGFHGTAALEMTVKDGTIQHIRRKVEQVEK